MMGNQVANDREPRRPVNLEGFAALENGSTFGVTVLDLSYDGCKIDTPVALLQNVKLKVAISGLNGSIDAAVRWCSEGKAGLRFYPDDQVATQIQLKPRAHQRLDVVATLSLRRSGRHRYQVCLSNLSPVGCKVAFVERPQLEELLWIKFDGLDALEARVRWVEGFHGGLEFVRPIYPAVFQLLVAKLTFEK